MFADLIGAPVEVVRVDDEAFAAGLAEAAGLPIDVGRLYASFGRAAREGQLDALTTTVQDLTGRAPRTLHDVLAAQLAEDFALAD